ncbi:hypothetical protein [Microbacterium sp. TNHR37B]|uniref:hypothetical protein n=1 Tax=Microbacterium sp. TNHR37B TaxID=1775956 RepID=UPI0007B25FBF|nr:hypothetical protein [Microbacterium sp. TNHR37B]KZE91779.1 hypothetical protein AVP41_01326 [Microbacterium sp. TNHR37B]
MTAETDTTPTANPYARPAEQFHFLTTGMMWRAKPAALFGSGSEISQRGQTVTITAEMLDASPWISRYLGDPEAQIEKWGEVRIAPGPFPADASPYVHGAPDWEEAREVARRRAWAITDPEERAAARAEVERRYGPAPTTSSSNEIREHHTERRAREQAERRARGIADRTR